MESIFDLHKFDEYRENNRLEVKRAKSGLPNDLWETYSAFANTNGGCIILGVKEREDKSWFTIGLQNVEKLKKEFWDTIHNHNKVSISLLNDQDVESFDINGDTVLIIKVPRARRQDKPVFIDNDMWGGTFRRDYEGDYHCTRDSILAMLRDQSEDTPDMKVLSDKRIEDFCQETLKSYRLKYNSLHEGSAWTRLDNPDFLVAIGAASDETNDGIIHPTAAGLLMFGQEFRITREFPEYFLDYREKMDPSIRWTDRIQTQAGDWSGNIYDFFTRVSAKLLLDLRRPFKTDGIYRIEETKVHEAVREALANCLVNADYFQSWSVVIEKYPDQIILANPGTIRLGKKQMLKGGISQPRNKNILKMFNLIGIGEHAGSGVPDIYNVWRLANYKEPHVEELSGRDGNPDRTVITLPLVANNQVLSKKRPEKRPEKGPDTIRKNQEIENRIIRVYRLIAENPRISRPELSERLNLSDKQIKLAIDLLKSRKMIQRVGSARSGHWMILETPKHT